MDNAIAQVTVSLAQFHEHLNGMHMDFHTENVFIKICDQALYNGKALRDYEYFEYVIGNGVQLRIPNMGFVIKLGDLGHASVNLKRRLGAKATDQASIDVTTRHMGLEIGDALGRLSIHKSTPDGMEALFGYDKSVRHSML